MAWCVPPLALQALLMGFDELYFHRARGLPSWERWGHPLDTASVLACYVWALTHAPSYSALWGYGALAAVSCLLVTKDEFVHAQRCEPAEHWLHAALFVLHPLVLGAVGWAWWKGADGLLSAQAGLTLAFGLYQLLYWNVPWKKLRPSP